MNQHLQNILNVIQQDENLSTEQKNAITKSLKDADKELEITSFKLDRTEKVKRTTAILLEETIAELENKRKAIEEQNRELEIESSLEKVRTVAMGMRKRDDMLDICRTISEQLELLGIKEIRNVQTAIFHEHKGTYINYEYYRLHDKALVTEVDYTNDEMSVEFAAQMIKGADEVFVRRLEGQEVKDWLNIQKTTNVFIDTNLENAKSLTYYWFSLGPVAIGMSAYDPLSEEEIALFKRFRNVFDLAYRRYLDIEKAEAQAREAQIEAALEKVRSRSLAMHKSDELQEVVHAVFERLNELNFELDTAIIIIFTEGSKDTVWWLQNSANQQYLRIAVDYADILYLRNLFEAKENEKDLPPAFYSFEQKNELLNYLFDHTDFRFTPPEQKESLLQKEWATMSAAIANNTAIHITRYSKKSFSEKEDEILKKFSNVFEQAYTRFLDLQKAEAQARESQIQLALERVRARTMAMQQSDELSEAASLLFKQVQSLGAPSWTAGYCIWDEDKKAITLWMSSPSGGIQPPFRAPLDENPTFIRYLEADNKGMELYIEEESGKVPEENYQYLLTLPVVGELLNAIMKEGYPLPTYQVDHCAYFSKGFLLFITYQQVPELHDIFKRFAAVFDQTYTRFLDLQKAEAQARESQIQLALERVRARAMAMQKSDELKELIGTVSTELGKLDIVLDRCFIVTYDPQTMDSTWWMANPETPFEPIGVLVQYHDYAPYLAHIDAWKERKLKWEYILEGKVKKKWDRFLFSETGLSKLPQPVIENMRSKEKVYLSSSFNNFGYLQLATLEPLTGEQSSIMLRFARVFDLTYTRFNDLKQAEAQAREAKIEVALERTRTQSMIMQHSKELDVTLRVFHEQVLLLGINSAFSFLWLPDEEKDRHIFWAAWAENNFKDFKSKAINYPLDRNEPATAQCLVDWKSDQPVISYHVPPAGVESYFAAWQELIAGVEELKPENFSDGLYYVEAFMKYGCFGVMIKSDLSEDEKKILYRFTIEFERTYTRFLDLQTAEAQARESQIQLALERVRARTMAMQKSDELTDVAELLFKQVNNLGIKTWTTGFNVWSDDNNFYTDYVTNPQGGFMSPYTIDAAKLPGANKASNAKKRGDEFLVNYEEGEALAETYRQLTKFGEKQFKSILESGFEFPSHQYEHFVFGAKVSLLFITYDPVPEAHHIFKRFGKVFEQTYTRFLDLQKAEAQAREAQIEAALERVRARAMAMHRSEELNEVANEMRKQLGLLGQNELETCAIHLYDESPDYFQSWAALLSPNVQGEVIQTQSQFPKRGVKIIEEMLECYAQHKQDYVLINEGAKAQQFLEMIKQKAPEVFEVVEKSMKEQAPEDKRAYWSVADFAGGSLVMTTMIEPGENSRALLRRFANVFGLAYRRFTDLKKAEAQAREAQIETALERVRSRTLAMQKSDELAETAAVLFKQLILLGINPNRLYINIIKDETAAAEFWITDEDGSKISMEYKANMNVNASMKKMYDGWRKQNKSMVIDMHGKELEEYFKHLSSLKVPFRGGLSQKRRLQYIAYFSKGFIGMASPDEQPAETMQLLERFAAVFNLTFTRFNDLKIAEAHALQAEQDLIEIKAARKKAEDTLTELQATQKQLVQSEKMASLGELTAGIAHEIQNPLNFVNNFSDVSNELLEEMKTELEKGHTKEVISIVDDVKQNLEKILHHGKRADAIVKGMLQHSRTSSSQKELTDINALADEYLRLAYHGLRAKDKSFNAKFITDFDNSVDKINIIPQEIGRVILNLINNAFYAVSEKQKQIEWSV